MPEIATVPSLYEGKRNIYDSFGVRLKLRGLTPDYFHWPEGLELPSGSEDDKSPTGSAPVLAASFGSLEETMVFYEDNLKALARHLGGQVMRIEDLSFDPSLLALRAGGVFEPWTARFVNIDFESDRGLSPVRPHNLVRPGWEMLAAAAQHPRRLALVDPGARFAVWMPGLVSRPILDTGWDDAPFISSLPAMGGSPATLLFSAKWVGFASRHLHVPKFVR